MAGEPLRGSCLCGGVRYEVRGPLEGVARCHCRECRKASGAEFATNASVTTADLHLEGEELLRAYESSPGQERCFCGRCGSPVLKRRGDLPGTVRIRLGCVDTPLDEKPKIRVFTAEKLGLSDLPDDGIPSFERLPGS